jgi:hypothetical protein
MFGIIIVMGAVILVEALFIFFFVTKAAALIEEYEGELLEKEYGFAEEKPAPVNKTAASVKKIWEGEV